MSDQKNPAGKAPVDDIEAAAAAAAENAAATPEPERDDAPPKPKPQSATGEKVKPQPTKKKGKARKASKPKHQQKSGPEQAQVVAKARKDARTDPEAPEVDEEAEAAKLQADLDRKAKVDELVENVARLMLSPLGKDETAEERAEELEATIAKAVKVSEREDLQECASECLAKADEAQAVVVKMRELHGILLTMAPADDGRSHNDRLKAVHKRSVEIRKKRAEDRLKLLAAGAGKSKLDQHLANQPRKSPADAAANPSTE